MAVSRKNSELSSVRAGPSRTLSCTGRCGSGCARFVGYCHTPRCICHAVIRCHKQDNSQLVAPVPVNGQGGGVVKTRGMATYDPIRDDQQAVDPGYTPSQITAAWKLMTRGDKEGLRKRDIERIIRTFRPNTTAAEFEHIVGPLKGRITFTDLKGILMSDSLPKDFDPVLAAFRIFDRDHSSSLSSDELKYFISQLPEIGHLSKEDMSVVMNLVDVDKDGICSFDDFRTFVTKNLERGNTKPPAMS